MFFEKTVADVILGQVSLTLSCLGLLTTFLLWPLLVIFQFTECERAALSDLPWGYLCGTGALALVFHLLVIFGITSTSALFISLGAMISILLNSLMDHVFRDSEFGLLKIIVTIFIIIGFLLLLIPLLREKKATKYYFCERKRRKHHHFVSVSLYLSSEMLYHVK